MPFKAPVAVFVGKVQRAYANSPWLVLKNETDIPLITSDNPLVMRYHNAFQCDFCFPITPRFAIVIQPIPNTAPREDDCFGSLKREGVTLFNQLIVQSAEDLVIFNESKEVEQFVREYNDWRVEAHTKTIAGLSIYQERAAKYK